MARDYLNIPESFIPELKQTGDPIEEIFPEKRQTRRRVLDVEERKDGSCFTGAHLSFSRKVTYQNSF